MHHSLSNESTCAASVLGSWTTFPDLIPHSEIVTIFKEKGKHMGKGKAKELLTTTDEIIDIDVDET